MAAVRPTIESVPTKAAAILRRAARSAAPVYKANGWRLADLSPLRMPLAVPTEADLVEWLARKWLEAGETGKCGGGGRLTVERWVDEELFERVHQVTVTLELAGDDWRTDDCGGVNPNYNWPTDDESDDAPAREHDDG